MIGFLGGSFDPVHYGHLKNCALIKQQLQLSELFLMPCASPVHKNKLNYSATQRLTMLELAIAEFNELTIDKREINSGGNSYTIDSIKAIKQQYKDTPVCMLIGTDSFNTLNTWKDYDVFNKYVHLVVINRPNYKINHNAFNCFNLTNSINNLLNQANGLIYFAKTDLFNISSSQINTKISNKQDLSCYIPQSIINYIKNL